MTTLLIALALSQASSPRVEPPLRRGDEWALERTTRWVNAAEEIDFAQVERFSFVVTSAKPSETKVMVTKELIATVMDGQRVNADRNPSPDTWSQTFDPAKAAAIAWAKPLDATEARLNQMTVFWLPTSGAWSPANPSKFEIAPTQARADGAKVFFSAPGLAATGAWSGRSLVRELKLTASDQPLQGSSFRGNLTLELKLVSELRSPS